MRELKERERFCEAVFERYLCGVETDDLRWDVPDKDPPDCWLEVGGKTYAVEFTSTPVRFGGEDPEAPTREEYLHACERLVDDVERSAKAEGILRGWYGVSFDPDGAVGAGDFRSWRQHVKNALLDYFRQTQNMPTALLKGIQFRCRTACDVTKYSSEKNHVASLAISARSEGDVRKSVRHLLEQILSTKSSCLSTANTANPTILVILNSEGFAYRRHDVFIDALAALHTGPEQYHTIFLVDGDGSGCVLRSANPDWQSSPYIGPQRSPMNA